MLRALTLICLFLSGCGSLPTLESRNAYNLYAASDDSCEAVTARRAQDAAYNGIDRDTQKLIYVRTYAECVAGRHQSGR